MARKKSALSLSPACLYRESSAVLVDPSQRLTADVGKSLTTTELDVMRSFDLVVPIRHALRDESAAAPKGNAPRSELPDSGKRAAARLKLPLHHKARGESPSLRPDLAWTPCPLRLSAEGGSM